MEEGHREHRLVLRVLARWKELRGERELPSRGEIEGAWFGEDWPACFMIDVASPVERSPFSYIGDELRLAGWDGLGQPAAECPPGTLLGAATAYLARVVDKGVPISIGGRAHHLGQPILFRSIIMPLSGDDGRIGALLGAANFRAVAETEAAFPQ